MTRSRFLIAAAVVLLTACALVWSHGRMAAARGRTLRAGDDLRQCTRMAGQIALLSKRPTLATDHERLAAETTTIIETSAKASGIPPERLIRISPEPPQRLDDSVYKEKPTLIMLRNVTLKQLVDLAHRLVSGDQGLRVKSIRLSAPRADDTGKLWSAELVITYLISDPPSVEKL